MAAHCSGLSVCKYIIRSITPFPFPHWVIHIHSKSRTFGGANISAPKIWRKKCVNHDDKVLQQMCVNHENSFDFVLKQHIFLENLIFQVFIRLFINDCTLLAQNIQCCPQTQCKLNGFRVISLKFGGDSKKIGGASGTSGTRFQNVCR